MEVINPGQIPVSSITSQTFIEGYNSLLQISRNIWEKDLNLPYQLKYNSLMLVEKTRPNALIPFYFRIFNGQGELARASCYVVDTDIASLDSELPRHVNDTIKKWYPNFMKFKVLECGHFTMLGEGIWINHPGTIQETLKYLLKEFQRICQEYKLDIMVFRDIPLVNYKDYLDTLKPLGFFPALGFPNTEIQIKWKNLEEYYQDLKSATRYKLKKSLHLLKEKFHIEYSFVKDYQNHINDLTRLWANVYQRAKEYIREFLDESYFKESNSLLKGNSEVLLFTYQKKPISFMLNVFDDNLYGAYHWGVDYDFEYYQGANLFQATNLLCLERAIKMGKKVLELGVTNYYPKLLMGAKATPFIYFIKHLKNPDYSKPLANMLTNKIKQPDNFFHRPYKKTCSDRIDLCNLALEIKKENIGPPKNDLFGKSDGFDEIKLARMANLYCFYPEFSCTHKSAVIINRKKAILLGTNSYLGAANHPKVIERAKKALDRYGTGCSGSPLLNGTLDIHKRLEEELALFMGKESVLLCSTGYQTNLAGISALCNHDDIIIMDEKSHRSLFDGVRLSGANFYVYRHNNMVHLEQILKHLPQKRKLIITDSVFSMEGTLADLTKITKLAQNYQARLFVDEAHGVGVLGNNGRGACELMEVEDEVDLVMGTFSKSFASIGGFIAGKKDIIDYIRHHASGHMFSASLPPAAVETVRAVLEVIREGPESRNSILEKARFMANELSRMGYDARFHGTQIVPIILGNETLTLAAYKKILELGVFVNPVLTPAVSRDHVGFRTSYIATHLWDELFKALDIFNKLRRDF